MPFSRRRNEVACRRRSPASLRILMDCLRTTDDGIYDSPRIFDTVSTSEERAIAFHCITDQPLIGHHFITAAVTDKQLYIVTFHLFPWDFRARSHGNRYS